MVLDFPQGKMPALYLLPLAAFERRMLERRTAAHAAYSLKSSTRPDSRLISKSE
jgi:hypothetical protein